MQKQSTEIDSSIALLLSSSVISIRPIIASWLSKTNCLDVSSVMGASLGAKKVVLEMGGSLEDVQGARLTLSSSFVICSSIFFWAFNLTSSQNNLSDCSLAQSSSAMLWPSAFSFSSLSCITYSRQNPKSSAEISSSIALLLSSDISIRAITACSSCVVTSLDTKLDLEIGGRQEGLNGTSMDFICWQRAWFWGARLKLLSIILGCSSLEVSSHKGWNGWLQ